MASAPPRGRFFAPNGRSNNGSMGGDADVGEAAACLKPGDLSGGIAAAIFFYGESFPYACEPVGYCLSKHKTMSGPDGAKRDLEGVKIYEKMSFYQDGFDLRLD